MAANFGNEALNLEKEAGERFSQDVIWGTHAKKIYYDKYDSLVCELWQVPHETVRRLQTSLSALGRLCSE